MTNEEKAKFMQSMIKVAENETDLSKQRVAEETGRLSGINFMIQEMNFYLNNLEIKPEKSEVSNSKIVEKKAPDKTQSKRIIIDLGKVKALRTAGWSFEKIADEFGCSAQTIINHLNRDELIQKRNKSKEKRDNNDDT